ncbi:DUF3861 domain-containing protein [Leeuwenhoekiella marinoflava]|uniref:DUF3861 family protein n=2 Tax=Leeuwenhoekiella marinoflava TaxID=988 RepID=A0A4Q0PQ38_9FLAO|nr:DUF3861 domain-containing protein [Leeuwenhoekiella marinoflava]RXG32730.1 putative protein DUF3861 [Leeuwenhoekiella marinoflava]SHE55038.1 protein of unknown function [Leeuwenhoekiella marinoflava DSM 3653]
MSTPTKKGNRYKLTLEQVAVLKEEKKVDQKLELEVVNHDELFEIVEKVKSKELFNSSEESTEFAIGLKLFTEVMLRNKNHPLFEELQPHIFEFMTKLKKS